MMHRLLGDCYIPCLNENVSPVCVFFVPIMFHVNDALASLTQLTVQLKDTSTAAGMSRVGNVKKSPWDYIHKEIGMVIMLIKSHQKDTEFSLEVFLVNRYSIWPS